MIIQKVQNKNPSDMKPFLDIVCSTFVIESKFVCLTHSVQLNQNVEVWSTDCSISSDKQELGGSYSSPNSLTVLGEEFL